MKTYSYIARLEFDARSKKDAEKQLAEYLENGDCDDTLHAGYSWELEEKPQEFDIVFWYPSPEFKGIQTHFESLDELIKFCEQKKYQIMLPSGFQKVGRVFVDNKWFRQRWEIK